MKRRKCMNIEDVIKEAETKLSKKIVIEDEKNSMWQSIIKLSDFIELAPEKIWKFVAKWGNHESEDVRDAVATCLLEHLLELHFDTYFPALEKEVLNEKLFYDMFCRCWNFGQSAIPINKKRFKDLCNKAELKWAK